MKKFFVICLLFSIHLESKVPRHSIFKQKDPEINDDYNEHDNFDKKTYRDTTNPCSNSLGNVTTITTPIIIDANNKQFDTTSNIAFQENLIYKPSNSYRYPTAYANYPAAIIVAKDNITIDLVGYTLSLDPSVNINPIHGIAVMPGIKNVKIISSTPKKNKGCISGFSGYAIYMLGTLNISSPDSYINMIKCPLIDNILIMYNKNGILISYALQSIIANSHISCNSSTQQLYGIYASNILDGQIDNCKVNLNMSSLDVYGIHLQDTAGTVIQNSTFNFNRSTTSGNAIGINITGTSAATSMGNKIKNCKSCGNLCACITGKESIGIAINDSSHHNVVELSTTLGQSNFLARGATAPRILPNGYGIKINNSNYNNLIENKSGYNDTYGFYDSLPISTSLYFNNIAILNKVTNYSIFVENTLNPGYSRPLPTIIVHQDMIPASNHSIASFNNIEVR